jgi:hypothetical protein
VTDDKLRWWIIRYLVKGQFSDVKIENATFREAFEGSGSLSAWSYQV